MSPGRASAAETTWRLFLPASALRTHVCTAAQPEPSILWPAWASDHVTKLAHHGLPGETPAAARYLSTSVPVLTPSSWTPRASSRFATSSADAPRPLEPEAVAAAASATAAGAVPGAASALAGPTGGLTAMKASESPFLGVALAASSAVTARKLRVPAFLGPGAAAGWPGAAEATAAAGAPGAAATGALEATSAGGFQLGSISVLKPRWTWSWWPASVK